MQFDICRNELPDKCYEAIDCDRGMEWWKHKHRESWLDGSRNVCANRNSHPLAGLPASSPTSPFLKTIMLRIGIKYFEFSKSLKLPTLFLRIDQLDDSLTNQTRPRIFLDVIVLQIASLMKGFDKKDELLKTLNDFQICRLVLKKYLVVS